MEHILFGNKLKGPQKPTIKACLIAPLSAIFSPRVWIPLSCKERKLVGIYYGHDKVYRRYCQYSVKVFIFKELAVPRRTVIITEANDKVT